MAGMFESITSMLHIGKRRRSEGVEEIDGSDYDHAKRRTLSKLDRAKTTASQKTLPLVTAKPRTVAPFENGPDTPRSGYVGNEKKQRIKPGNTAGFRPTDTLAQPRPGRPVAPSKTMTVRRESDTQSAYFQSASSGSTTNRSQGGQSQLGNSSVGQMSFKTSTTARKRRRLHEQGQERQSSLNTQAMYSDETRQEPECYVKFDNRKLEFAGDRKARTTSTHVGLEECDLMQYDDSMAQVVLTRGLDEITNETAMHQARSRAARQPTKQSPVKRTPERPSAHTNAPRLGPFVQDDDSEDELAGGVTVSSAPVQTQRQKSWTPQTRRLQADAPQQSAVPEWRPAPPRLGLAACFCEQFQGFRPDLELLWDDKRDRFYLFRDNTAVHHNHKKVTLKAGKCRALVTADDCDVVLVQIADVPATEDEVWLQFKNAAQIRWFLKRLEANGAKSSKVDSYQLRRNWNNIVEGYKKYGSEDQAQSDGRDRQPLPSLPVPEGFASSTLHSEDAEIPETQEEILSIAERPTEPPIIKEQVEQPSGAPGRFHSRNDDARTGSSMQKLRERKQSREENGLRSESRAEYSTDVQANTRKLRDRMQEEKMTLHDDPEPLRERRLSSRTDQRHVEEPREILQVEDIGERRRSSRAAAPSTRRAPSPEPIVRWTHVNKLQPWSQPVVFPDKGPRRVTVEFADLERLDEGELLNDTLISFAIRRIEERMDPRYKVHFFNSYFYSSLTGDAGKKGYEYRAISRWTKNADLLANDFIVVPINHNLHWFAAIMCNVGVLTGRASQPMLIEDDVDDADHELSGLSLVEPKKHFLDITDDDLPAKAAKTTPRPRRKMPPARRYDVAAPAAISLDSFGYPRSTELGLLKDYLVDEAKDKRDVEIDKRLIQGITAKGLAEQTNFSDCGVFVIAYLEAFAQDPYRFVHKVMTRELDFSSDYPDIKPHEMRKQLRDALLELYTQQEADRQAQAAAKAAAKATLEQQRQEQHELPPQQVDTPQEPMRIDA